MKWGCLNITNLVMIDDVSMFLYTYNYTILPSCIGNWHFYLFIFRNYSLRHVNIVAVYWKRKGMEENERYGGKWELSTNNYLLFEPKANIIIPDKTRLARYLISISIIGVYVFSCDIIDLWLRYRSTLLVYRILEQRVFLLTKHI